MEVLITYIQPFFGWLLQTTLIASVVICLILLIQKILGGKLGPRWSHALWLVLLIRMVLPWSPSSRVSLSNLIPSLDRQIQHRQRIEPGEEKVSPPKQTAGTPEAIPGREPESEVAVQTSVAPRPPVITNVEGESKPRLAYLRRVLPILWLAGAMVIGACLLVSDFALWRIVKRDQPLVNQSLLELFEECKAQMGVQSLVVVVPSGRVRSPGLFGFVRPRLLLPREMLDTATREEMRYVFLHELAHLRRHDIYLGWLTSLLQVLHWFNPLVWFAFYRMRADRELVCDALVLTRTGQDKSQEYGGAIVGLLRRFSRSRPLPAMAGIIEDKSQLKRRIAMITQFRNDSYRWSPLALVLIIGLACLALPDARKNTATANEKPAGLAAAPMPAQRPTFRKIRIPNRIHYHAQMSPDGKSIALGFDDKLWIIPRIGTLGPDYPSTPQLVNTGEIKVDPYGIAWSADGQWIAFNGGELVLAEKREGNYRMYVVSAQGGKPKEVYDAYRGGYTNNRQMSLSPNGRTLAFSAVDANELHIYTIPVEGGVPKRLVDAPAREPVFSPDGKMIAYVEDKLLGQGGGGLWVVPADGGTPRLVTEASDACSPVWSPDGRIIAFFDWENRQIYVIPIDEPGERAREKVTVDYPKETGTLHRLTGWTPDSKIGAIFRSPAEFGLYTLSLKGGPATRFTHGGTGSLQPRWSPDGKRIIHTKWLNEEEGGNWLELGLASIAAEGGELTVIPIESDTKIYKAGWGGGGNISPDGKTIVFAGCKAQETATNTMHIWTLPIEGGKPTQLTDAPVPLTDKFPCWSPDGKAIAFVRSRESENILKLFTEADICIIPSVGGEPRQLTSESDMVAFGSVAWSRDGKLLAYLSIDNEWPSPDEATLRVIPVEGGKSRVVTKLRNKFGANKELAWSPDSWRIAFNDRDIRIVSLDDGRVVDIDPGVATTEIFHLDWSRDGEKLAFAGYQGGEIEFWLIENFLPVAVSSTGK